MSTDTTFEQRLATVEKAVHDLQNQLAASQPSSNWLQQVIGSVTDEEAFREILAYGREFREADRPADEDADRK